MSIESTETHPAVSDALREAVAQWLRDTFSLNGWKSTAIALGLLRFSPIASRIARLTGEREAAQMEARNRADMLEATAGMLKGRISQLLASAEAAEAETARLRAALEWIADQMPATCDMSITHDMAFRARAALSSQEQSE